MRVHPPAPQEPRRYSHDDIRFRLSQLRSRLEEHGTYEESDKALLWDVCVTLGFPLCEASEIAGK